MGFSGGAKRFFVRIVFLACVFVLQNAANPLARADSQDREVESRKTITLRSVTALDSISGWMDRFGIATGWNK